MRTLIALCALATIAAAWPAWINTFEMTAETVKFVIDMSLIPGTTVLPDTVLIIHSSTVMWADIGRFTAPFATGQGDDCVTWQDSIYCGDWSSYPEPVLEAMTAREYDCDLHPDPPESEKHFVYVNGGNLRTFKISNWPEETSEYWQDVDFYEPGVWAIVLIWHNRPDLIAAEYTGGWNLAPSTWGQIKTLF